MRELIINQVNRVFKCDALSNNRYRENVNGRIAISYYLRMHEKMTLMGIARILKKDHASVIHYLKQHQSLFKYDKEYKTLYSQIIVNDKPKQWLCNECTHFKIDT